MKNLITILLITMLCIYDGSPEIRDEKKTSRDVTDYELQEKDYQSFPARTPNMRLYDKLGLLSDNMNLEHKSAYASPRNKFRLRHNRNGKVNKKRFQYAEPRSAQESKQQRLNDEGELNVGDEGLDFDKHYASKKHAIAKRWPLRRLRKYHGLKEATRFVKSDSMEDASDYDEASFDGSKGRDTGSYVLVPEHDQLVQLRNLNLTKEARKVGNDLEQPEHSLVMHIKKVGPGLDSTSTDKESNEEPNYQVTNETEKYELKDMDESNDLAESCDGETDDQLRSKLKQEILNCTTAGLEKYLNFFGQKSGKSSAAVSVGEQDKNDLMKLNITINGLVMNDDKTSKIHGNGTIKVKPSCDDERTRRAIKIPFMKKFSKEKDAEEDDSDDIDEEDEKLETKKDSRESAQKQESSCEEVSNPDAGLTPDKLSNEIVKMVSHMVRSNPKMKTLWPSLRRNRPTNKGAACNLRTTANCSGRKQIEDMLRKAMASVNDIIEKEVQSRSCVPLSEDLAEFYEVILEMHAKQAKRKEEREEMLIKAEKLDKEPTDAEEKPKKKHCKSKSKREEPDKDFEDDKLFDMMHSRRLQYDEEVAEARRRREAEKRTHELIKDTVNSSLVRQLRQMYSPAFLKLNNAVEGLQRAEVVPDQM